MLDEEGQQFDKLFEKTVRTEGDNQAIEELASTGHYRRMEYLHLVAQAVRTDAETARVKELEALAAANEAAMERLVESSGTDQQLLLMAPDDDAPSPCEAVVEQNKRIIEQNDQIIALLKQLVAKK